jgi:hypothetical protein
MTRNKDRKPGEAGTPEPPRPAASNGAGAASPAAAEPAAAAGGPGVSAPAIEAAKTAAAPGPGTGAPTTPKPASEDRPASAAAKPPAAPPKAAPPSPPAGGGLWPGLLGGLIGGAAAVLAVLFWLRPDVELAALQARMSELQAASTTPAALQDRIGQAEQQLTGLTESVQNALAAGGGARDALASLEGRLPELESALAETGSALQGLPALEQRLGQLEQAGSRLDQLTGTIDRLDAAQAADRQRAETMAGTVEQLGGRLDQAEQRLQVVAGQAQRAAAMILALGDIDRALVHAEPFASALDGLRGLAGNDQPAQQAIADLAPVAAAGAPDLAALRASFGDMAVAVTTASAAPEGEGDLLGQATANLLELVQVRPVGEAAEGSAPAAILARAEAKLDGGDLAGAVAELEALAGPAAEAAAGWLTQARQRLAAEAAVEALRSHARDLLAQGS